MCTSKQHCIDYQGWPGSTELWGTALRNVNNSKAAPHSGQDLSVPLRAFESAHMGFDYSQCTGCDMYPFVRFISDL
jgi:hypothetical protein